MKALKNTSYLLIGGIAGIIAQLPFGGMIKLKYKNILFPSSFCRLKDTILYAAQNGFKI